MLKKAISFGLIGLFSITLLAACGQPSDKVEPTVTREAVEMPPPSTPAAATTETASAPAAGAGGETNLTLNAVDIAWEPKELTGPADQEFTITITNKGAAEHDFSIPDLNILTDMIAPGSSVSVKVKAPAGTYQYICTVPGHKEAGMVGTLTLVAGGGAATTGEATAAGGESAGAATGGETNLTLDAIDIAWEPKELTGPADQEFTITITNKGAAQHDFSIPDLNITTELINPGQSVTVKVKAPAGTYQYICTVPGHKEAGMVGTLTLAAGAGAPAAPAEGTAATDAGASAEPVVKLEAVDIAFKPTELTIKANTPTKIEITNTGAAEHDFSIDELGIAVNLPPGATETVEINAPAGTYQYYCNIPGHKEAGMVGTLTVQ